MYKMALAAALTLCAVPAFAAPDRFAEMDKDTNGQVSWEEFSAALPSMKKPAFEQIDTDKNGSISREEWTTFRSSHGMGGMSGMKTPEGMTAPGGSAGGMPLIQPPSQK